MKPTDNKTTGNPKGKVKVSSNACNKRKRGLFKKANELGQLTGAHVWIFVRSSNSEISSFCTPKFKSFTSSALAKKMLKDYPVRQQLIENTEIVSEVDTEEDTLEKKKKKLILIDSEDEKS